MAKSEQRVLEGFLSVSRVAETFGLSHRRVLQEIEQNAIPYISLDALLLVDIDAFTRVRASRVPRRKMRSSWRDEES